MRLLPEQIALVTGASRGAGRGIAVELGAAGATVYVTGRSVAGGPTTDNVPGTIDDTAREVTARGGQRHRRPLRPHRRRRCRRRCSRASGRSRPARCARQQRLGRLRAPRLPSASAGALLGQSLQQWDGMFTAGVRAHLTASRLAAPLMLPQRRGLIVSTTANLGALPYLRESLLRSVEERGRPYGVGDGAGTARARHRGARSGAGFHADRTRRRGVPPRRRRRRPRRSRRTEGNARLFWPRDRCAGVGRRGHREIRTARSRSARSRANTVSPTSTARSRHRSASRRGPSRRMKNAACQGRRQKAKGITQEATPNNRKILPYAFCLFPCRCHFSAT